ncbi:MAG: DUF5979 domain-containing protein, partial [Actinomycetota bacterium]
VVEDTGELPDTAGPSWAWNVNGIRSDADGVPGGVTDEFVVEANDGVAIVVTFVNPIERVLGSTSVTKLLIDQTGRVPSGQQFTITYVCRFDGSVVAEGALLVGIDQTVPIDNLPIGTECRFDEPSGELPQLDGVAFADPVWVNQTTTVEQIPSDGAGASVTNTAAAGVGSEGPLPTPDPMPLPATGTSLRILVLAAALLALGIVLVQSRRQPREVVREL